MKKVLIVEDDAVICSQISRLLEELDCEATSVGTIAEAKAFKLKHFNLIISELELPDAPGTDLIRLADGSPVLIMTSYASLQSAVDSMRKGAIDYIAKPFADHELKTAISRIFKAQPCHNYSHQETNDVEPVQGMIGSSPAMQTVYTRIRKAAPTRSTVLIRGETGTGKELAARAIHDASDRSEHAFVAVNCAAIPETLIEAELFGHEKGAFTGAASKRSGLIEAAEGGTLFLDEIGELPSEAQARLLRFIQESEIRRIGSNEAHKVDVRLIAATHRDLKKLTTSGGFRPDLYYRINVVRIDLPALNQRGSDLLEIAEHLLERAANRHNKPGLHLLPDAIQAITSYSWPGNVRELENVIERAAIMADGLAIDSHSLEIDLDLVDVNLINAETLTPFNENHRELNPPVAHSSPAANARNTMHEPTEDLSLEDYFQRFVLENQDQMSETELAKKLGISRKCLWERRQRFDIPRKKSGGKSSQRAV